MLIPLICNQCGGKLEVEDTKVLISGDSFIVLPDQKFECPHCGTKYVSGNTSKQVYATGGGIAIGGIAIGGEFKGSIVIGNGVNPETSFSSKTQKQPKKWWEFWK
jgi:YgiT-type zinc finger domain-containing protein